MALCPHAGLLLDGDRHQHIGVDGAGDGIGAGLREDDHLMIAGIEGDASGGGEGTWSARLFLVATVLARHQIVDTAVVAWGIVEEDTLSRLDGDAGWAGEGK